MPPRNKDSKGRIIHASKSQDQEYVGPSFGLGVWHFRVPIILTTNRLLTYLISVCLQCSCYEGERLDRLLQSIQRLRYVMNFDWYNIIH